MNVNRIAVLALLVVGLLGLSVIGVAAKGPPGYVDFEVPGMWRNFRLEEPDVPMEFGMGQFADFMTPVKSPDNLGAGFMMTSGGLDENGEAVPWDRMFFFANLEGELGYVYYFGLVNGSSEYDGRWFSVTATGQAKLIEVLNEQGVHFAGLNPGEAYTYGEGASAMASTPEGEQKRNPSSWPQSVGALSLTFAGLWWLHRPKRLTE